MITRPTLSPGPTIDDATSGLPLSMDGSVEQRRWAVMGRASRAKHGRAPRLHGATAELAATTAAHLVDIEARYPGCWATLERMRGLRAEMGWPAWCWVPMSGAHAVVGGGEQDRR